jgi:hypothetical protein
MTPGFLPPVLIEIIVVIVIPLLGVIYTQTMNKIARLETRTDQAGDTSANLAISFARYQAQADALQKQFDEMFRMIREIRDKLDDKADKPSHWGHHETKAS